MPPPPLPTDGPAAVLRARRAADTPQTTAPSGHPDTVLRMALAAWCGDPAALDDAQRDWLRTRLTSHTPLTPGERLALREPLLAWARALSADVAALVQAALE